MRVDRNELDEGEIREGVGHGTLQEERKLVYRLLLPPGKRYLITE
jgi:hypothetical protein